MSAICLAAEAPCSSLTSGQPSGSVHPFCPVSRAVPFSPESASRTSAARSLKTSESALPSWKQIVPPSGLAVLISSASFTPSAWLSRPRKVRRTALSAGGKSVLMASTGIQGCLTLSSFARASPSEGTMAIAAAPVVIRSSTICSSPSPSAFEAGPAKRHS